ncbi:ricin-type beta-trefoil lectin domain protein [Streptomyces sp. RerS4]|uniref:ricin-type beta-trefoil lectin domain protein n=1 Tax=Streptomyces sp. RerS4 TaxID=2942449 RepID=UPI00201C11DC|nr:ricin-type beta-trefoil lectin domain protein [Streptomyces sp. RerS4]UQX04458.1 ricin-type beta-trefoil lectin domain protein [Streptomyces sp. RerS4]
MGFPAKYRIPLVGVCTVAAVVGGLQLTSTAFGTEDPGAEPTASSMPVPPVPPVDEAPDAHAQDADAPVSGIDANTFTDGVMKLDAGRPAAAPRALAAAGAPPQGEGWKLSGATKWLATGYTIKFPDQKSADWLGPYVKATAADLQRITNLPVTVDTRPVGWSYARPKGEVVISVLHRPCLPPAGEGSMGSTGWKVVRDGSGSPNLSCGFTSSSVAETVTSGHAYIDDEFFTPAGKPTAAMGETYMRNHISHEIGHTLGLTHANRSLTKGDCVKGTDSGQFPVMCSPAYAYQDKRAGTYVQQFDVQGLRRLAAGAGAALNPQGKVSGPGGKCLDVKGGKAANGTQIQLYTCNGTVAQSWILGKDGTLRALGKCLDNSRNLAANGNKISLWDCNGSAAQRWSVNAKGQIVHTASGKVLDVKGGSTANGTVVQLYTANTDKRQVWVTPK